MTSELHCSEVRLLLPELALGTAAGEDRARALDHVDSCADCRRELQSLAEVGDQLLLLAPVVEAPAGFESRVLDRLSTAPPARRRARWWGAAAAAVLLAIGLSAGAVYLAGEPDRELAQSYRETLGVANGRYVAARPLLGDGSSDIGYVFGYQGSPSWIFCVVRDGTDGTYDIEVTAADGAPISAEMEVVDGEGTWHQVLDNDLHDLRRITLTDRSTGRVFQASW